MKGLKSLHKTECATCIPPDWVYRHCWDHAFPIDQWLYYWWQYYGFFAFFDSVSANSCLGACINSDIIPNGPMSIKKWDSTGWKWYTTPLEIRNMTGNVETQKKHMRWYASCNPPTWYNCTEQTALIPGVAFYDTIRRFYLECGPPKKEVYAEYDAANGYYWNNWFGWGCFGSFCAGAPALQWSGTMLPCGPFKFEFNIKGNLNCHQLAVIDIISTCGGYRYQRVKYIHRVPNGEPDAGYIPYIDNCARFSFNINWDVDIAEFLRWKEDNGRDDDTGLAVYVSVNGPAWPDLGYLDVKANIVETDYLTLLGGMDYNDIEVSIDKIEKDCDDDTDPPPPDDPPDDDSDPGTDPPPGPPGTPPSDTPPPPPELPPGPDFTTCADCIAGVQGLLVRWTGMHDHDVTLTQLGSNCGREELELSALEDWILLDEIGSDCNDLGAEYHTTLGTLGDDGDPGLLICTQTNPDGDPGRYIKWYVYEVHANVWCSTADTVSACLLMYVQFFSNGGLTACMCNVFIDDITNQFSPMGGSLPWTDACMNGQEITDTADYILYHEGEWPCIGEDETFTATSHVKLLV